VHLCIGPPASWYSAALNHPNNDSSVQNQVSYATSSLFRDVTQRRLVAGYRHFGTTYQSHLQGSCSPKGSPETSVTNCHSTLRDITEGRISHWHRGGSLQSLTFVNADMLLMCSQIPFVLTYFRNIYTLKFQLINVSCTNLKMSTLRCQQFV
jgi:hypothetical protein